MNPVPIFISYALEDQSASQAIQRQLVIMRRKKKVAFYDQHQLSIGRAERWESIQLALNQSPIIVLILSDYFIASDECYDIQELSLKYSQASQSILIPILFKNCAWQDLDGVSRLQPLPRNRVFIKDWLDADNAFAEIAREIGTLAQQIIDKKIVLKDALPLPLKPTDKPEELKPEKEDPRQLIARGQLGKALEVLSENTKNDLDINGQIITLQAQLASLSEKIRKGIISAPDERLERNQIIAAALDIINEI